MTKSCSVSPAARCITLQRPFLEFHLRRRVAALANVTILDNHEVIEPVIAADTVTGARIINSADDSTITVTADLVVDATGARRAHALSWTVTAWAPRRKTGHLRRGATPVT